MNKNQNHNINKLPEYLINIQNWNEEIAIKIAKSEDITLYSIHWKLFIL